MRRMQIAPVTAPPRIEAGMTRRRSAAANGIAPLEMNERRGATALPFSRSTGVNRPASQHRRGESHGERRTMPAAMTNAMT